MDNEVKVESKKRQFNPDRIVLESRSVEIIKAFQEQIESSFGGVIKLTNKEIANFIIQSRSTEFSGVDLKLLKDQHFDEVRAAQWAVQKLKEAKSKGQEISLAQILAQIQTPRPKLSKGSKSVKPKDVGSPSSSASKTIPREPETV